MKWLFTPPSMILRGVWRSHTCWELSSKEIGFHARFSGDWLRFVLTSVCGSVHCGLFYLQAYKTGTWLIRSVCPFQCCDVEVVYFSIATTQTSCSVWIERIFACGSTDFGWIWSKKSRHRWLQSPSLTVNTPKGFTRSLSSWFRSIAITAPPMFCTQLLTSASLNRNKASVTYSDSFRKKEM